MTYREVSGIIYKVIYFNITMDDYRKTQQWDAEYEFLENIFLSLGSCDSLVLSLYETPSMRSLTSV